LEVSHVLSICKVGVVSILLLSGLTIFMGAKPTLSSPGAFTQYGSDATFDSSCTGTASTAVTFGVWDVGDENYAETRDATTSGGGSGGGATVTFNPNRNEWNMGQAWTMGNANAQVRVWYQSTPAEYDSRPIYIDQSPP
jgi:hypothetical protein